MHERDVAEAGNQPVFRANLPITSRPRCSRGTWILQACRFKTHSRRVRNPGIQKTLRRSGDHGNAGLHHTRGPLRVGVIRARDGRCLGNVSLRHPTRSRRAGEGRTVPDRANADRTLARGRELPSASPGLQAIPALSGRYPQSAVRPHPAVPTVLRSVFWGVLDGPFTVVGNADSGETTGRNPWK